MILEGYLFLLNRKDREDKPSNAAELGSGIGVTVISASAPDPVAFNSIVSKRVRFSLMDCRLSTLRELMTFTWSFPKSAPSTLKAESDLPSRSAKLICTNSAEELSMNVIVLSTSSSSRSIKVNEKSVKKTSE